MKKTVLSVFAVILLVTTVVHLSNSSPTGAPAGRTGSPSDLGTCFTSGCHFGSPTPSGDLIVTGIPTDGYTPDATYTITVKVSGSGSKGFQFSAQKANGTKIGTITPGSGSKYADGNSKYVTHTAPLVASNASWIFQWKAPATNNGPVDLYAVCAVTRNNTFTQKLTVYEKGFAGVNEVTASDISVYPNPLQQKLQLGLELRKNAVVRVDLYNLQGQNCANLFNETLAAGPQHVVMQRPSAIKSGLYIVRVELDEQIVLKKIFVD